MKKKTEQLLFKAQDAIEAAELLLRGALKILGVDYPKVHDVAPLFSEQARKKRVVKDQVVSQRIEAVSLWLAQSRTPSFYSLPRPMSRGGV